MKRFITKTITFCTPLLIIFLIPAVFLYMSGENYRSIDNVITSGQNYLIGYAYNEGNYKYLKHKELDNQDTHSVIALGSSRILQFRDKMFTTSFYNAGYTISSISDFVPFIASNFKNKKPEILLIALDQWMFNENWDNLANYNSKKRLWNANYTKNASITTIINVWADLFSRKYGFEILFFNSKSNEPKIGLNAIVNNKGFRKDGSIFYGNQIEKLLVKDSTANDFDYLDTYSRINSGNRRFEYGKKVSEKSMQALNDLLLFCKSNDIYVVAILPPFANSVNSKMKQSGKYAYMDSIYFKSNELFEQYNFELWDMSNLTKYHSNDNETLDGFHGSEVSYLKILIYMIENGSKIKNFTNHQKLKDDLTHKENDYSVYPNHWVNKARTHNILYK